VLIYYKTDVSIIIIKLKYPTWRQTTVTY